jgi:diguanylate cyclase (GGDEF)-like protein
LNTADAKLIRQIDEDNNRIYMMRTSAPAQAIAEATKLLELSRSIQYRKGEGHALRTIAATTVKSNPQEAFPLANQAIEILTEVGDISAVAGAKMTVFCYFHHLGWFEQSFEILKEALEQAKSCGNRYICALSLYNMGVSCEERKDYDQASDYYSEAMKFGDEEKSKGHYWAAFGARARLRALTETSDEVVSDLEQAADEVARSGSHAFACDIHASLATLFAKRNLYSRSVFEIRRGRRLAFTHSIHPAYAALLFDHAEILLSKERILPAKRTFKRALEFSRQIGYSMMEVRALERLAFVYQQLGDYQLSAQHLYEYVELKEKLQSEHIETRMQDMQAHHKLELVRNEVERANQRSNELAAINEELHVALEQQAHLQRELMRLASTDELTGILNRRQVLNDGILEMERYRHMGATFTVTLIDIDHFKSINDTFGHASGDEILRRLSKCCTKMIRKFDVFGRLGGEEFCIIHHDTDVQGAIHAVERLAESIAEIEVSDLLGERKLTVSMGISEVHYTHNSFYDVLHDADMSLYEAKHAGRNTYRVRQSRALESPQATPLRAA